MRRLSTFAALIALAAMAGPASAHAGACPGGDVRPAVDNIPQIAQTTLCLINDERTAAGLPTVTEQADLTKASLDFSALMVSEHFFAHVSPDGGELTDRLTAVGYLGHPGSWTVGENIAWGESYLATPDEIVKAWMNSPPHRKNILSPDYEEIGLGIVIGTPSTQNPGATYTTDFGRRRIEPGDEGPASEAQGDLAVGEAPVADTPARSGTRGASTRSAAATRRVIARRAARKARAACRRGHRGARSAGRSHRTSRIRCVGAWRAVHVRL